MTFCMSMSSSNVDEIENFNCLLQLFFYKNMNLPLSLDNNIQIICFRAKEILQQDVCVVYQLEENVTLTVNIAIRHSMDLGTVLIVLEKFVLKSY